MLKTTLFLSFNASPLMSASFRLQREAERSMASEFATIRVELPKRFFELSGQFPTNNDPAANRIKPKPDVAGALGITGDYDIDNAGHIGLACDEGMNDPNIPQQPSGGRQG